MVIGPSYSLLGAKCDSKYIYNFHIKKMAKLTFMGKIKWSFLNNRYGSEAINKGNVEHVTGLELLCTYSWRWSSATPHLLTCTCEIMDAILGTAKTNQTNATMHETYEERYLWIARVWRKIFWWGKMSTETLYTGSYLFNKIKMLGVTG